ncbi:MAG: hypothetical protein LBT55_02870 [Clostridiaceae bacterium]|jgi:hypothetical protein|nr:hypothetical protein [Clostridiaceae bacterium]
MFSKKRIIAFIVGLVILAGIAVAIAAAATNGFKPDEGAAALTNAKQNREQIEELNGRLSAVEGNGGLDGTITVNDAWPNWNNNFQSSLNDHVKAGRYKLVVNAPYQLTVNSETSDRIMQDTGYVQITRSGNDVTQTVTTGRYSLKRRGKADNSEPWTAFRKMDASLRLYVEDTDSTATARKITVSDIIEYGNIEEVPIYVQATFAGASGETTLEINGLGTRPIYFPSIYGDGMSSAAPERGWVVAGNVYQLVMKGGIFMLMNPSYHIANEEGYGYTILQNDFAVSDRNSAASSYALNEAYNRNNSMQVIEQTSDMFFWHSQWSRHNILMPLNQNKTIYVSDGSETAGVTLKLLVQQDATGGYTLNFAGGKFLFPVGAPIQTATAGAIDYYEFFGIGNGNMVLVKFAPNISGV